MNKLAIAFATLLLAVGLTGCSKKIDDSKLETKINEFLADKNVTASAVSCPADIKEKKGESFDCTATVDDKTLTITVEMQGDGAVTWKVSDFGGYEPQGAPPVPAEPPAATDEPTGGHGSGQGDGE